MSMDGWRSSREPGGRTRPRDILMADTTELPMVTDEPAPPRRQATDFALWGALTAITGYIAVALCAFVPYLTEPAPYWLTWWLVLARVMLGLFLGTNIGLVLWGVALLTRKFGRW